MCPVRLRPWFSNEQRWSALCGMGVSLCLQRRILSILVSHSWVMVRWNERWTELLSYWVISNSGAALIQCGEEGAKLSVKLSVYLSIHILILTYGHEIFIVAERIRSWIKVDEMSFLQATAGLKQSHLRWDRHLIRMFALPMLVCQTRPIGRKQWAGGMSGLPSGCVVPTIIGRQWMDKWTLSRCKNLTMHNGYE